MRINQMLRFDILYLLFGIIICFIYKIFNKENNKIQIIDIVVIIILILLSSLRCNVGSDYFSYYLRYNGILSTYQNIAQIISLSNSILFDIICYLTLKITSYKFAIFWVVSVIIYLPLIIYLRKNNKKPYLGLFVFIFAGFFLITNNIIRQSLAMVMIFISYFALDKKKYFLFIVLIVLASLFHKTALISAVLILISRKIKPSFKSLGIANIIGILIFFLFMPSISLIDRFLPTKYLDYIVFNYGGMIKQTLSIVGYFIFYNIIACVLINNKKQIKEVSNNYYKMISTIIVAIPVSIIAIRCWPINRIAIYLYSFIIVLLPMIYSYDKAFTKFKLFLSVFIMIWFFFITIFGGDNEYYNYDSYINKSIIPDYPRNIINR